MAAFDGRIQLPICNWTGRCFCRHLGAIRRLVLSIGCERCWDVIPAARRTDLLGVRTNKSAGRLRTSIAFGAVSRLSHALWREGQCNLSDRSFLPARSRALVLRLLQHLRNSPRPRRRPRRMSTRAVMNSVSSAAPWRPEKAVGANASSCRRLVSHAPRGCCPAPRTSRSIRLRAEAAASARAALDYSRSRGPTARRDHRRLRQGDTVGNSGHAPLVLE